MATISVPEDLLAGLQAKAQFEGKTVDEVAEEALRASLKETTWDDLLAYGRGRGRLAGFTEEQSADVVHDWRKEQRL